MRPRREASYTSGVHYFLRIQRPVVNYSAHTTVTTPQDIDQMMYFKAFVWFSNLNCYCELDYFFRISSNASVANSKTLF